MSRLHAPSGSTPPAHVPSPPDSGSTPPRAGSTPVSAAGGTPWNTTPSLTKMAPGVRSLARAHRRPRGRRRTALRRDPASSTARDVPSARLKRGSRLSIAHAFSLGVGQHKGRVCSAAAGRRRLGLIGRRHCRRDGSVQLSPRIGSRRAWATKFWREPASQASKRTSHLRRTDLTTSTRRSREITGRTAPSTIARRALA
jgi:hypothetical protein